MNLVTLYRRWSWKVHTHTHSHSHSTSAFVSPGLFILFCYHSLHPRSLLSRSASTLCRDQRLNPSPEQASIFITASSTSMRSIPSTPSLGVTLQPCAGFSGGSLTLGSRAFACFRHITNKTLALPINSRHQRTKPGR